MKPRRGSSRILGITILVIVLAALLAWTYFSVASADFLRREHQLRQEYPEGTIDIRGTILSEEGRAVAGAMVILQDQTLITPGDGSFSFSGVERANSLITIEAGGFRTEFIPVHLYLPINATSVTLDPILLTESDPSRVRFLFGGDTHFGRRYLDPLEKTPRGVLPPDDPAALIRVSNPETGTRQVVQDLLPFFREADFASVNLESPVVKNLSTPHREKEYVLFTLPGSLPALAWLGVDYVSTGNNHVYDYLDQGLADTLDTLRDAGIPTSGAGINTTVAFQPYRVVLGGTPYSFLSMTSIDGSEHTISYVANSTKGGAADLKNTAAVISAIRQERAAGMIPIIQVHGGDEYTYEPSEYIKDRMAIVAGSGAGLVVSHHPHIAQGIGIMNGVVVIEGLGNLAFDAERHETKLGLLARVEMDGEDVQSVRLIPVFIENFTPRLISGSAADLLLRRIGEFSGDSPYPVYPYNGQGWVALAPGDWVMDERVLPMTVTVPESGSLVLDLRAVAGDDESLAWIWDDVPHTTARVGRDLMLFGDFEDWDIDGDSGETDLWDIPEGSALLCLSDPHGGTASLCSVRHGSNDADSVVAFRNRIRVMGDAANQVPNKELTLVGYVRGENAGKVSVVARYLASEGEMAFGDEEILALPGGTFPWQQVLADIHLPPDDPSRPRDPAADPRAAQIFIRQAPPPMGIGIAEFDDLAVVTWEESITISGGSLLKTPHAREFLRITGRPGTHHLVLTFRSYRPAIPVSA